MHTSSLLVRVSRSPLFRTAVGALLVVLVSGLMSWALNPPTGNPPSGTGNVLGVANGAPANALYVTATGKVGVSTTGPAYLFEVGDGGSTTARFGASTSATVSIGNGTGKLNVGTIDPLYRISGALFSTYMTGMTGQKEETAGVVRLAYDAERGLWLRRIDFREIARGSDLWLFYQVTDFGAQWEYLSVLVSANFPGTAWYEKGAATKTLTLYAEPTDAARGPLELSYRLIAPRFDWKNWVHTDQDQRLEGFVIDEK